MPANKGKEIRQWPMLTRQMEVAMDLEMRAEKPDDPRIPLSLSSEAPVDRWFGREILEHSSSAIDLSYARHGLPFLADHDGREQIGILEDVTLGKDKKLRGWAKAGNNPDAQWRFQDIRDGVRPHISVGYAVRTVVLEKQDEQDGDTYRVTRWTPMEASTVAVPADISVGVGRNGESVKYAVEVETPERRTAQEPRMAIEPVEVTPAPAPVAVARDYDAERKDRLTSLRNLAKLTGREDWEKLLSGAIERDLTPRQFQDELADQAIAGAVRTASVVELTPKEQKQYMLTRIMNAAVLQAQGKPNAWKDAGLEREVSEEMAKHAPVNNGGFFVPFGLASRAAVTGNIVATASLGGAGVQTTILDLIELLRNQTVVIQAGARVLTGLHANITFPRQITANTLTWTGENPATGNTNTAATFDTVALTPKTAMVSTAVSRQLIVQSTFDAENFIREDLAAVIALGIDSAAINGIGSSNQPTGLRFISGVPTVTTTFGTDGAIPNWAAMVAFETTMATNNAPGTNWKGITTPGIRGVLKQTLRHTTGASGFIWGDDNTINGYPWLVTNQVPSNLTHGTSTTIAHAMLFGNWAEMIIAEWAGGVELLVDPYTVASQNMIQFHTFLMMDVNVRHPKSFAIAESALI
jgi:HK97 family phage major capsid protein